MRDEQSYTDFLSAMGESFSESVSPPVPCDLASPQECCEAVWSVLGEDVTPDGLASLSEGQIAELADGFGSHFDAPSPSAEQIRRGIEATLSRWPVGSLS